MILVVGDGNFSYSASLSQNAKVIATSFEDHDTCIRKYGETARQNILLLEQLGSKVCHSVDATRLEEYPFIETATQQIIRIIFNFPHVGRKAGIKLNRTLLHNFFVSASKLTHYGGKVEVSLCAGQGGTPDDSKPRDKCNHWQIVDMAAYGNFILTDVREFIPPNGYESTGRRGAGNQFNTAGARVHIFEKSAPPPSQQIGWQGCPLQLLDKNEFPSSIYKRLLYETDNAYFFPPKYVFMKIYDKIQSNSKALDHCTSETFKTHLHSHCFSQVDLSNVCLEFASAYKLLSYNNALPQKQMIRVLPPTLCTEIQYVCKELLTSTDEAIICTGKLIFTKPSLAKLLNFSYEMIVVEKTKANQELDVQKIEIILCSLFNEYSQQFNVDVEQLSLQKSSAGLIQTLFMEKSLPENVYLGLISVFSILEDHQKVNIHLFCNSDAKKYGSNVFGYSCSFQTKDGSNICITILILDLLSCLLIDELDQRNVLWSLSEDTQKNLSESCLQKIPYRRKSLHPPSYTFHISFWILKHNVDSELKEQDDRWEFTEEKFLEILSHTCDDLLKSVKLTDKFVESDANTSSVPRTSLCYEMVFSSHEYCLSKSAALDLHAMVGSQISKYLRIKVIWSNCISVLHPSLLRLSEEVHAKMGRK